MSEPWICPGCQHPFSGGAFCPECRREIVELRSRVQFLQWRLNNLYKVSQQRDANKALAELCRMLAEVAK